MGETKKSETRTFDRENNVVIKTTRIEKSDGTYTEDRRVYENTFFPESAISITKTTGKVEKK